MKAGVWKYNSNDQRNPEQVRTVAAIARHPEFNTGSLAKDLAILILSQPLIFSEHVGKICIPSSSGPEYYPTASSTCVVTGWGKPVLQGEYCYIINLILLLTVCDIITLLIFVA